MSHFETQVCLWQCDWEGGKPNDNGVQHKSPRDSGQLLLFPVWSDFNTFSFRPWYIWICSLTNTCEQKWQIWPSISTGTMVFHVLIFFVLISVDHLLQGFPLLLPSTRATRASTTTTAVAAATPDAKIGCEKMQSCQLYVWLKLLVKGTKKDMERSEVQ